MADWRRGVVRSVAVSIACLSTACAPLPRERPPADIVLMDSICARSLQQLDMLIEGCVADGSTALDVLAEARALRAAAAELYLDGENELALELIDQALALLGSREQ